MTRKDRLDARDPEQDRAMLRRGLERLRTELRGRDTLLSGFTFAGIAVEEFGDLLAWRDKLYAERRSLQGAAGPAAA